MRPARDRDAQRVQPVALLHQEGVLGLLALAGLAFTEAGPAASLAPRLGWTPALLAGVLAGLGGAALLLIGRVLPPLRRLERWQRRLVADWTTGDAVAVAVLSGLAEEALLRALLQPLIGLLPAAVLFAVLHVVPDRRAWFWPLLALVLGLGLGQLFEIFGYPAAALAHGVLNGIGLQRLRRD